MKQLQVLSVGLIALGLCSLSADAPTTAKYFLSAIVADAQGADVEMSDSTQVKPSERKKGDKGATTGTEETTPSEEGEKGASDSDESTDNEED